MLWKMVLDDERSALCESINIRGMIFEVLENRQLQDQEPNGYLLYEQSTMRLYSRAGNAVGGLGLFCAVGAPPEAVFGSVSEAKHTAELIVMRM